MGRARHLRLGIRSRVAELGVGEASGESEGAHRLAEGDGRATRVPDSHGFQLGGAGGCGARGSSSSSCGGISIPNAADGLVYRWRFIRVVVFTPQKLERGEDSHGRETLPLDERVAAGPIPDE